MRSSRNAVNPYRITGLAIMAAIVYVVTLFRFPFLGSKVHLANSMCLVAGLLFGPVLGGISAGLGSALYDAFAGGYDLINVLITFVSKFAMAWLCAVVYKAIEKKTQDRRGSSAEGQTNAAASVLAVVIACICGALCYVALYMLKTFVYQAFVYSYPMETVWAAMISKLIPSLINALAAMITAPIFYHAVLPALRHTGMMEHMQA